jgi:hypothetical protein
VWVYGDKQMRWLEDDDEEVHVEGKDFDDTYSETVLELKTLPATPQNLKQLEPGPH